MARVVSVSVLVICTSCSFVLASAEFCQIPFVRVPFEIVASTPGAIKESVPPIDTLADLTAQTPTISVTMVRQNIKIVENNFVLSFI